jgi:hypothetical protein
MTTKIADTIPAVVAYLNKKFPGKGYGADYQAYAAQYPGSDPLELYAAFVLLDAASLPGSLLKTEAAGLGAAGNLDQTAVAATSSLDIFAPRVTRAFVPPMMLLPCIIAGHLVPPATSGP